MFNPVYGGIFISLLVPGNTVTCDLTEDMLCAVQDANLRLKTAPDKISLFSMDVEALYPSLDLSDIKVELVKQSLIQIYLRNYELIRNISNILNTKKSLL